ncbi:MAG: hypothetical protein OXU61_03500 [Gammaproteobacteria bacterium]|nr:hypothetical protein [Gammaproteobacteria bacterium]MDD9824165.1 hypothetical protein [Gammaproteobacteria bacterium]MDD9864337.1 hypothetical protein [Gammaproteobacteria bacterium]
MHARTTRLYSLLALTAVIALLPVAAFADDGIPDLVGDWKGVNYTLSDLKGYREWGEKVVHITEQRDRRFRGYFVYSEGRRDFFGVIFPDNVSFVWVASNSRGYNHGRIMGPDRISACYVETWEMATVGCADMTRQ